MTIFRRQLIVVLAIALPVAGCGVGGPAHGPPDARAAAVVDMGFESFTPATVTVKAGQAVEWRNTSPITHSVSFDSKAAAKAGDAALPPAVQPFASGDIAAGEVYLHTFDRPGTYRYFCTHHESGGMLGTVVVQ
ncbi:MAG: cupredoxin domain-containing protein [Alphaproteobacteria bacterium]|nr:cupredoxin domain-containing protein [Alphaproteobacteria bacterium]MDE1930958.1 cupredoxin domain-containing protein [Alphaproteobacteria bacterium]